MACGSPHQLPRFFVGDGITVKSGQVRVQISHHEVTPRLHERADGFEEFGEGEVLEGEGANQAVGIFSTCRRLGMDEGVVDFVLHRRGLGQGIQMRGRFFTRELDEFWSGVKADDGCWGDVQKLEGRTAGAAAEVDDFEVLLRRVRFVCEGQELGEINLLLDSVETLHVVNLALVVGVAPAAV